MKKEEIYLDLSKLSSEQIKNVGKVLGENNQEILFMFSGLINAGKYFKKDKYLCFCRPSHNSWTCSKDYNDRTEITYNEFLILFEKEVQEAWQPKQGEKVSVSKDSYNWEERIFVVKNKDKYFCEPNDSTIYLYGWKFIKPFKEEIKVGDFIQDKEDETIFKVKSDMNLDIINSEDNFIKITNPQLIELLEQWTDIQSKPKIDS